MSTKQATNGDDSCPKWFQLLYEQQYGQGITAKGPATGPRVGLTPAFLLGAVHLSDGRQSRPSNRAEFVSLLTSMANNATGKLVHIAECPDMLQPRASLTDGAMGHLGDAVLRPDGSSSSLYASPAYFAGASRDVESLADGLWNILGASISQGGFSYRDGTWQKFAPYEEEFIDRAFKKDHDI